jgi:hypothetical protein
VSPIPAKRTGEVLSDPTDGGNGNTIHMRSFDRDELIYSFLIIAYIVLLSILHNTL